MLVVADDLTGAADTAGVFASAGHECSVVLGIDDEPTAVLAVDTNSRAMSASAAFEATAAAVRLRPGAALFVKIDSTLRGHVRSVVEGALSALDAPPARIVVCPAFPARGRTVSGGVVHVDGEPLQGGNLRELFSGFPAGAGLFLPSVESDEQLAGLVAGIEPGALWVGSAGIAAHLARAMTTATATRPPSPRAAMQAGDRVAVVVGTQHAATIEQLAGLAAVADVHRIDPRDYSFVARTAAALATADALVVTGGHTARAILDALGIDRFRVRGEVEIGVPWSTVEHGGRTITLVTKAGGFGDADTLHRCVQFLRGGSGILTR